MNRSQFRYKCEPAWDGSALELQATSGHLIDVRVTTGAEAAATYLHYYNVASEAEIESATPFWSEPLTPSYYNPFTYGPAHEFVDGCWVTITDANDGSGDPPANPVLFCARYR